MTETDDTASSGSTGWFVRILAGVAILVLVMVLYALSIGPAAYLYAVLNAGSHRWLEPAINVVYLPLIWWFRHDMPGRHLLEAYVEWWAGLA